MGVASTLGLARSLAIYYGQPWKWRRMDALYGELIRPGDLAFDVGAHVGNRVRSWLRLGARVVAIEPQPVFVDVLRRLYGGRSDVTVVPEGVASAPGALELNISSRHPTVSTFSGAWIEEVKRDPRFAPVTWDRRVSVAVTTLDALIEAHGEPRFCKIDVEGFELDVLRGLSRPIAGLSFEALPAARDRAIGCVERVASLGDYGFRSSPVETMRWAEDRWITADEAIAALRAWPEGAPSGDWYARRRSS